MMRMRASTSYLVRCITLCWSLGHAPGALAQAAPQTATDNTAAAEVAELMPRYLLQDHRGRVVSHEDFRGRFQLVTFGFTSCPDVCPTTLLTFKNILAGLGNQAERLQPIFISVDPERDTAAMLGDYTAAFDTRILGLRGSPELLQRAAQSFRVRYEKVREPGAAAQSYTMDHSTGMYLLGTDGRHLLKFAITAPADEITARIGALMMADHSPLPTQRRGNAPLR